MTLVEPRRETLLEPSPHAEECRSRAARSILRVGRNCESIDLARRAAVLIDAASYFSVLEDALLGACRSVLIIAWDFDARVRLRPEGSAGGGACIGDLLRTLVEERPELEVRILVWSLATLHAPGAASSLLFNAPWQDHPRIHLRLDTHHPVYATHHQKIVCIDDALAFVGGIDLTVDRWDTSAHPIEEPRRTMPNGTRFGPVHDVQMFVDGPAACAISAVAKRRWRDAIGEELQGVAHEGDAWPDHLQPDFREVEVGVATTFPMAANSPAIRQCAVLIEDALASAERTVYLEAQYLSARRIRNQLVQSLRKPHGPEIVAVVGHSLHGLLEQFIMGANQDRLTRALKRADRHDRLRIYYPVVGNGEDEHEILIHSKLMIIDDRLVRVGSSNFNNRSVGLDTECDLAIEGRSPADQATIAGLRHRLLAEHLDASPEEVAEACAAEGSLIQAIERLNTKPRRLRLLPAMSGRGPTRSIPGTRIFDPEEPLAPLEGLRRLLRRLGLWRRADTRKQPRIDPPPRSVRK